MAENNTDELAEPEPQKVWVAVEVYGGLVQDVHVRRTEAAAKQALATFLDLPEDVSFDDYAEYRSRLWAGDEAAVNYCPTWWSGKTEDSCVREAIIE